MVNLSQNSFTDSLGRVLMLRGVNLGGSSKVPLTPDGSTYRADGFFDHHSVSFVGRPFPLEEADEHYSRLRSWGFNTLRFLVTWEAIEHAGPGIHDQAYLDYLYSVVKKAGEHGFFVFIDPHQDVWSRFSGGDGAPGWTLEAAGLDMTKFKETGAAIVHQTHGDPFPRMIWPTNAYKLAAATMFTLFFAGNDFAPATRVEGLPIQDYLQSHYFSMIRMVAESLRGLDCVIGYDVFNEPQRGYIGFDDLRESFHILKNGAVPTPWQSILLGSGYPQRVQVSTLGLFGFPAMRSVVLNREKMSAWLPGKNCVWRENGVWDVDAGGKPLLLRPDHFSNLRGRSVDFSRDYLVPFTRRFAETIHSVDANALIFMENEVEDRSPLWSGAADHSVVYAPHWYDGSTLMLKQFIPWLGADMRSMKPVLGRKKIRQSCAAQLKILKDEAAENLGNLPVLIGEIGIPFDLQGKKAYRTGNFTVQTRAMDRSMEALEANLLSFTLWNYTADNDNQHGDRWNDEDLSIYSSDQRKDPEDINSGGRALLAVVRPYPIATAGQPLRLSFDYRSGTFEYSFKAGAVEQDAPTVLFIPTRQYPAGMDIQLSDGACTYDAKTQLLEVHPGNLDTHTIRISRK